MTKQLQKHCDCRNYAPVDVVKGICHRTKELILGDDNQCEHYDQLNKCKYCGHYTAAKEEFMGTCNADPAKPWTYPDLITVTCTSFKA
jgi:4-hydroxyphenylacetate decarboxylase small subunit